MREVRARLPIVDDPEVEEYVASVGRRLAAASDTPTQPFHFFVVAHDEINAFAGPGGYIGVNSGLIANTESESEFASVLAHEMAHVTQHHIARRFEQQERSTLPVFAGIVAAVVLGSQSPDLGQAAAAAALGSAVQSALNFSREAEREADRVGMQFLSRAGYDPWAMPEFLETLQSAKRFTREPPEYLSTHPLTTSRIADLRARAERAPRREHEDNLRFWLLRAKLKLFANEDPKQALARFKGELELGEHENLSAAAYGLGLALMRTGAHDKAREVFAKLIRRHPEELTFLVAVADNEFEAGRILQSIEAYNHAYERYPSSRALAFGLTKALVQSRHSDEALAVIDAFARFRGVDHRLHRLEAEAYAQRGEMTRSRFSLAEHYYLSGQLDAAIHQLELAAKDPDAGFYLLSRVEARLEEIREERSLRLKPRV